MINWEERYRELEDQMAAMLLQIANKYDELEFRAVAAESLKIKNLFVSSDKSNVHAVAHANGSDIEYAFAIYGPERFKIVSSYSKSNSYNFSVKRAGRYRIWVHVREVGNPNNVVTKKSSEFKVNGVQNAK